MNPLRLFHSLISQPRRTGARARLHNLLLPYHRRFADPFGALDVHGLCAVLRCLGEPATPDRIRAVLCQVVPFTSRSRPPEWWLPSCFKVPHSLVPICGALCPPVL